MDGENIWNNHIRPNRFYELVITLSFKEELKESLFVKLKEQGDPRMFGNGHVFDEYPYFGDASANFYDRFMKGEEIKAGWVNESDFEKNFKVHE